MVPYNHRLAGSKFSPLDGESSFGALLRIAWYNELQRTVLWKMLTGKGGAGSENSFLRPKWINTEIFFQNTGWYLPQAEENKISLVLGDYTELWFSPTLRICPICFEFGYHSIWFQLNSLRYCPIHACEVQKVCLSCGHRLPAYRFGHELFDTPFCCYSCGAPLSGAPLSLWLGAENNEISASQEKAFAPYVCWLSRFDSEELRLTCLEPAQRDPYCEFRSGWLETALAERYNPLPPDCSVPLYYSHAILRWKIQMQKTQCSRVGSYESIDFGPLHKVLRTVVRRLEYWVFDKTGGNVPEEIQKRMRSELMFRVEADLDPAIVAYMHFRDIYVSGSSIDESDTRNNTYLRNLPNARWTFWESRLPRVAFRSVLFGAFAELYQGVVNARARDRSINFRLGFSPSGFVSRIGSTGLAQGFIAFPEVRGMPISLVPPWRLAQSINHVN